MADDAAAALDDHLDLVGWVRDSLLQVEAIAARLIECFDAGGKLLSFGNGGSACDSMHLAEELLARFKRERRPLGALSLAADSSALTCIANDYSFDDAFARQVEGLASPGDVVVGFTTSGRSENVVRGLQAARKAGATTVLFAGGDGLPALEYADLALVVPSSSTARVQEMHVLLLHLLLEPVDAWAAGE